MKRRSCGGGGLQKQLAEEAEIEGMLEQFKKSAMWEIRQLDAWKGIS